MVPKTPASRAASGAKGNPATGVSWPHLDPGVPTRFGPICPLFGGSSSPASRRPRSRPFFCIGPGPCSRLGFPSLLPSGLPVGVPAGAHRQTGIHAYGGIRPCRRQVRPETTKPPANEVKDDDGCELNLLLRDLYASHETSDNPGNPRAGGFSLGRAACHRRIGRVSSPTDDSTGRR